MIALVLLAGTAWAQSAPPDPKKRAAELYELGGRLFAAKQYDEAAKMFAESYSLDPLPAALFNRARCLEESGKAAEAIEAFRAYLEADPDGGGSAEAQTRLLALERKLEADRLREAEERRRREAEERRRREATMPRTEEVVVDRGAPLRLAGFTTAGGGALLFTAGILFGVHAANLDDQLSSHAGPWTERELAMEDDGKLAERLQIGLMITGGAALATGAVLATIGLYFSEEVEVRPIVRPDSGGASVSLRF